MELLERATPTVVPLGVVAFQQAGTLSGHRSNHGVVEIFEE
jgi:hypothetical protein